MQARTRNRMGATAAVAMAALAWAGAANHAAADPRGPGLRPEPRSGASVAMRTLMQYRESAWLEPTAVLLHSQQAWEEWNRAAVQSGLAVAEEILQPVNWDEEAVLVVALGMNVTRSTTLELSNPRRAGTTTEVTLHVEAGAELGPSNPCHVVALAKRAARSIRLVPDYTDAIDGLPNYVPLYGDAPAAEDPSIFVVRHDLGSGIEPVKQPLSWGTLKASYR